MKYPVLTGQFPASHSWGTLIILISASIFSGCAATHQRHRACSSCGTKVCVLDVSSGKETVNGFDVKSKDICVPPVLLPWQECISGRCGKIREVCVLEDAKKERSVCEYEWSVKTICPNCQAAKSSGGQ